MPPYVEAGIYAGAARGTVGGNPVGVRSADLWVQQNEAAMIAEAKARPTPYQLSMAIPIGEIGLRG